MYDTDISGGVVAPFWRSAIAMSVSVHNARPLQKVVCNESGRRVLLRVRTVILHWIGNATFPFRNLTPRECDASTPHPLNEASVCVNASAVVARLHTCFVCPRADTGMVWAVVSLGFSRAAASCSF